MEGVMPQFPKKKAAKLRSWRVSIIRKRGQYLGTVEAANEKAAEAAAVAEAVDVDTGLRAARRSHAYARLCGNPRGRDRAMEAWYHPSIA
jgi:hypothetical protein